MTRTTHTILLGLMTLSVFLTPGFAAAGFFNDLAKGSRFNPAEVGIESVTYGGVGCPQGTVTALLSPDASELTVLFDAYETRVGADLGSSRADCEVRLNIRKPRLWAYKINSVDFRGFVHLDDGVKAVQKVDFKNGVALGGLMKSFGYQKWQGPVSQNYFLRTVQPVDGDDVLSCLPAKKNIELKIRSSIELSGGGGHRGGMMTVDSVDGRMVHRYKLSWISCLKEFGIK